MPSRTVRARSTSPSAIAFAAALAEPATRKPARETRWSVEQIRSMLDDEIEMAVDERLHDCQLPRSRNAPAGLRERALVPQNALLQKGDAAGQPLTSHYD